MKTSVAAFALLSAVPAFAQSALYAQCGGKGFTGSTSCVSGAKCTYSNDYYSQCLPGSNAAAPAAPKASTSTKKTTTSAPAATASPKPVTGATGQTFKSSFTFYGAGDTFGSPNCNTNTAACGFYTSPGFSAAVSQNEFGVGPGAGAGPACGTCWALTGQTDSSGNKLSSPATIVVMVNNLCPASGNPLCSQSGLTGTNQYGANLNFDLCADSGAKQAFFGNSGVGLAIGTATQVDCSQWKGTIVH